MTEKYTIKRKKRFIENIKLEEYTGLIFISSITPKVKNNNKPLRINMTNLYFYKNKFCLIDNFIPLNAIKIYISKNYDLTDKILTIDKVYYKKSKVIYIINLKSNTIINNFTIFKTINLYKTNDYKQNNHDIYEAIYKNNKHIEYKKITIYYDNNNYIETTLNTIFYYLIGNSSINKSNCI